MHEAVKRHIADTEDAFDGLSATNPIINSHLNTVRYDGVPYETAMKAIVLVLAQQCDAMQKVITEAKWRQPVEFVVSKGVE